MLRLERLPAMPVTREKTQLMSASEIDRTLVRLAHEILESTAIWTSWPSSASAAAACRWRSGWRKKIEALEQRTVPVGILDINLYRDDLSTVSPPAGCERHRHSVSGDRQGRDPDGRRAVYRPHHPRGARRAVRSRAAGAGAIAGADRPRPSRTADRSAATSDAWCRPPRTRSSK